MPAPRKYDDETRARAIRMCQDRISEGGISKAAAYRQVGELVGISPETLRGWVDKELAGHVVRPSGEAPGEEVTRLRRENAQLKRANEILRTASAFFAAAELDRKLGQ